MTATPITEQDIARLVTFFYGRIRVDAVLGPIFNEAIEDWPHHLEKLQAFWSSVVLTSGRYKGQPMIAHLHHEQHMTPANFAHWLHLWALTADELLGAEAAAVFQEKARRIAESLQLGIQHQRERKQVA